jgi:hypothetical protein
VTLQRSLLLPEALVAAYRLPILTALAIFLSAHGALSMAAGSEPESALILKIGKFVHWPPGTFANSAGVLRLCIVGTDSGGESIDALAGQKLQDKIIAVVQVADSGPPVSDCHILFIKKSERDRLGAVLDAAAHSPALTISDIDGFAAEGGMVGLTSAAGTLHFEINVAASKRAGLTFGAQLLQIAALSADQRMDARP